MAEIGKFKSLVLGARLRQLRKEKGVKGPAALSKLMRGKYSGSGILRREAGKLKIDTEYLEDFSRVLNLSEDDAQLLKMQARLGALKAEQSWAEVEQEYTFITTNSKCIYNYRSSSLPLELQTDEYTWAVNAPLPLGRETLQERVSRHLEMKQLLRQKKDSEIRLLCPEWVLYIPYGSPRIMLDQMVCLREYADTQPIEFRILPSDVFPSVPLGRSYKIYNHNFCRSASRIAINTLEDKARIAGIEEEFLKLWSLSVKDQPKFAIIEKAIAHYREMVKRELSGK